MSARDVEAEIDRLYQLPPEEFTSARNALAKRLQGEDAKKVKALKKPNLPAWAVNQLHWTSPDVSRELRKAADRLREAHRLAITGRPADLKEASANHREALRKAVVRIHQILREAGRPVNVETTRAVTQTLEALREEDSPGRLDRPLAPEGFDVLMDVAPPRSQGLPPLRHPRGPAAAASSPQKPQHDQRASAEELRRARNEAAPDGARALRDAKHALETAEKTLAARRRAERAARQESRMFEKRIATARRDEACARQDLDRAEKARAGLEEKAARAATEANQAAGDAVASERAVRNARDILKSLSDRMP